MEKSDNKTMKVKGGEYFTVRDMAKNLGVTLKVVNMRLFRLGVCRALPFPMKKIARKQRF